MTATVWVLGTSTLSGITRWREVQWVLLAGVSLVGIAALRMPVLDLALWGGLAGSLLCILFAERCGRLHIPLLTRALTWGVLWAAVASAVIAGCQFSGLLKEPATWMPWLHASPSEEAYGQLRQRNQFGSLVSLGLAAWFYLAHTGWSCRGGRWLAWGTLLILILGAVASSSRTGALTWCALAWVGMACTAPQAASTPGPSARAGAGAALIGFVTLCWILPGVVMSFNTVELPKASAFERLATQPEGLGICESRVVLWRHVLELSLQQPWFGWGWGELDLAHATQPVQGERFCGQLGNAHTLLLQVAVEWGWPMALAGLGVVAIWLRRHPPWRANTPRAVLGWCWLGVIGFHSLLEFPLWYGPFQMLLGLSLGLIHRHSDAPPTPPPSPSTAPSGLNTVLALWLTCIVWAGWDYHRVSQVFQPAAQRSSSCRLQPLSCLDEVVWFHQARDFARLRLVRDQLSPDDTQNLAQRVAHYAPEPWVLALRSTPTVIPTPSKP